MGMCVWEEQEEKGGIERGAEGGADGGKTARSEVTGWRSWRVHEEKSWFNGYFNYTSGFLAS